MSFIWTWRTLTTQKPRQNRHKPMESVSGSTKRFSMSFIRSLFVRKYTTPLKCYRKISMSGCGTTMKIDLIAGNIVTEKRQGKHSMTHCCLQRKKCCSIVTACQSNRKYDKSSDDIVTSTCNGDCQYDSCAKDDSCLSVVIEFLQ